MFFAFFQEHVEKTLECVTLKRIVWKDSDPYNMFPYDENEPTPFQEKVVVLFQKIDRLANLSCVDLSENRLFPALYAHPVKLRKNSKQFKEWQIKEQNYHNARNVYIEKLYRALIWNGIRKVTYD